MDKVFGIPSNLLAIYMSSILVIIGILIIVGASRRFIFFKMGTRNIPRRKGQSALIIIGLMLSSTIIAMALGIGDTVRYSVRSVALDYLGNTDEVIKGPGQQIFGEEYFDYSEFKKVENLASKNNDIDSLLPVIDVSLPASNNSKDLAESTMRVRGADKSYSDNFDSLESIDGDNLSIKDLSNQEVYINEVARDVLNLKAGDEIGIFTVSGEVTFIVKEVVKNGGLAGGGGRPFVVLELSRLQSLLDKEGKITEIYVSNVGQGDKSLELSESVTKYLRSNLANKDTALEIFNILSAPQILSLLTAEAEELKTLDEETSQTITDMVSDLKAGNFSDDFITTITDYQLVLLILGILDKAEMQIDSGKLFMLSTGLIQLRVDDQKNDSVKLAERVASGVTQIFSIFGSFSIMVGMLLIFLVFVLLAAARSKELGMARAVGLKRRDLVQLFTYEGTVYSLLAAIVGTSVGVGLSFGLVYIMQDVIDTGNFTITPYYSLISIIIAFSSGLILTFFTVVISAYRASNLNIVVAIRGLKEEFVKKPPESTRSKIISLMWDLVFPVKQIVNMIVYPKNLVKDLIVLLALPITWPFNLLRSLFKLAGKHSYLILGFISLSLLISGLSLELNANFVLGLTGTALAFSLFLRFILGKFISGPDLVHQISGTLEGGSVLLLNSLPFDFFEPLTGELTQPGPWFWPLGGAISTAAAVWLLMSNTRILIFILNLILSPFSGLKAVTKTAISYPMAAKFRTGLTVAMFALIIFTLMIFSVLSNIGDIASEQPDRVTGGFDISASISQDLPITGDIRDSLEMNDFSVVAGVASNPIEARELNGENNIFKSSRLVSTEEQFFSYTKWNLKHYDPKYGSSDKEIWSALIDNPNLVIASAGILEAGDPFGPPDRSFKTSYLSEGDPKEMKSFDIQMKQRRSSNTQDLTVIGVVEPLASGLGGGSGGFGGGAVFYSNESLMIKLAQKEVPFGDYYFVLKDPTESLVYAQKLEKTFLRNGMSATSLKDAIEESRETQNAFNRLFQGFSGLGLVVGVAAIGVLTVRAVVERRQSIGVLRAIGFKSSMIRTQFLIESSFITLLGVVVGIFLGVLQSWLIFQEISESIEGARFVIPFRDVGFLVGLTVFASILTSVIPSHQASKIYPAEALRHE